MGDHEVGSNPPSRLWLRFTLASTVLLGLLFSALVYPLTMFVRQKPALAMMLSLYVTLGICLLLAAPTQRRVVA
jgi:hypothetical protein